MFVNNFVKSKGLRLCPEKCALITSNKYLTTSCLMVDDETSLLIEKSVKCLGVMWDNSTSSKACVNERIQKARAAFLLTSGVDRGVLWVLEHPLYD